MAEQEQKRADRDRRGITFESRSDAFTDKVKREGKAASTMVKTTWLLKIACAEFGTTPISEITAPMILTYLRGVEAKGNYETAKRLRARIGSVFRDAVAKTCATDASRNQ